MQACATTVARVLRPGRSAGVARFAVIGAERGWTTRSRSPPVNLVARSAVRAAGRPSARLTGGADGNGRRDYLRDPRASRRTASEEEIKKSLPAGWRGQYHPGRQPGGPRRAEGEVQGDRRGPTASLSDPGPPPRLRQPTAPPRCPWVASIPSDLFASFFGQDPFGPTGAAPRNRRGNDLALEVGGDARGTW